MRREFSDRMKADRFLFCGGRCEAKGCGAFLKPGKYHADHDTPDALGGKPTLENCRILCLPCHRKKTGEQDVPTIAKAIRRSKRNAGIRKPQWRPLPGTRASGWKKKMSGEIVRRS